MRWKAEMALNSTVVCDSYQRFVGWLCVWITTFQPAYGIPPSIETIPEWRYGPCWLRADDEWASTALSVADPAQHKLAYGAVHSRSGFERTTPQWTYMYFAVGSPRRPIKWSRSHNRKAAACVRRTRLKTRPLLPSLLARLSVFTYLSHDSWSTMLVNNCNLLSHKYVCITTKQPNTKSKPNPNAKPNPTTKLHAMVNIQLNIDSYVSK